MARGQQKIQSQQKAKEKQDKMKKQQGHDQKKAAAAGLKHVCTLCKVRCRELVGKNFQGLRLFLISGF